MIDKLRKLNLFWVVDPKTGEVSVSLTMLVVTFIGVLVACGLEMAGVIENTSVMTEIFYASVALYFGRRFSFKGQEYSSDDQPSNDGESK